MATITREKWPSDSLQFVSFSGFFIGNPVRKNLFKCRFKRWEGVVLKIVQTRIVSFLFLKPFIIEHSHRRSYDLKALNSYRLYFPIGCCCVLEGSYEATLFIHAVRVHFENETQQFINYVFAISASNFKSQSHRIICIKIVWVDRLGAPFAPWCFCDLIANNAFKALGWKTLLFTKGLAVRLGLHSRPGWL